MPKLMGTMGEIQRETLSENGKLRILDAGNLFSFLGTLRPGAYAKLSGNDLN